MNFEKEKEILEHVRQHPGCDAGNLIEAIGHPDAADEADYMVQGGKLDCWHTSFGPRYCIHGTYPPHYLTGAEKSTPVVIPLAAGLHRDGTIHIYVEIDRDDLLTLMKEYGVHQEAAGYIQKMLIWGYLYSDDVNSIYRLTDAGKQTATIRITVPRLKREMTETTHRLVSIPMILIEEIEATGEDVTGFVRDAVRQRLEEVDRV